MEKREGEGGWKLGVRTTAWLVWGHNELVLAPVLVQAPTVLRHGDVVCSNLDTCLQHAFIRHQLPYDRSDLAREKEERGNVHRRRHHV